MRSDQGLSLRATHLLRDRSSHCRASRVPGTWREVLRLRPQMGQARHRRAGADLRFRGRPSRRSAPDTRRIDRHRARTQIERISIRAPRVLASARRSLDRRRRRMASGGDRSPRGRLRPQHRDALGSDRAGTHRAGRHRIRSRGSTRTTPRNAPGTGCTASRPLVRTGARDLTSSSSSTTRQTTRQSDRSSSRPVPPAP